MRIAGIIKGTMSDGPGIRNSIYFQGCSHHCEGCHNKRTWDFDRGSEMSVDFILEHVLDPGVEITLSGGDPLDQYDDALELCKRLKAHKKNIWIYTGYKIEDIDPTILKYIDVLVDGKFELHNPEKNNRFCGSANQRIIKLKDGKIETIT